VTSGLALSPTVIIASESSRTTQLALPAASAPGSRGRQVEVVRAMWSRLAGTALCPAWLPVALGSRHAGRLSAGVGQRYGVRRRRAWCRVRYVRVARPTRSALTRHSRAAAAVS
jgi:hypothetical protein